MTDDVHMPESQDGEPTTPSEMAGKATEAVATAFSSGEGMVSVAGMLLLAIWLIFDVFLDDWGLADLELMLAFAVVVLPRMNRDKVAKFHPLPTIMKIAGYALAILGAFYIIEALEEGFYDDALTIIAALGSYAAYAIAFLGARSIKT